MHDLLGLVIIIKCGMNTNGLRIFFPHFFYLVQKCGVAGGAVFEVQKSGKTPKMIKNAMFLGGKMEKFSPGPPHFFKPHFFLLAEKTA